METVRIAYGKTTLEARLPEGHPLQILEPKTRSDVPRPEKILREALEHPIASPSLRELTKDVKKILIITNDNTRPMPSRLTLPAMIDAFYHEEEHYDITILIATGLHHPMTPEQMREQFGDDICDRYRIVNHVARNKEDLVSFGTLSTGNPLYLNKLVAECELVVAEGFIEPHFFAGYSGGRKSILPGVAGEATVLANHRPEHIADPRARQANLDGNPIHDECAEAAYLSGLKFILNVALDKNKQIIAAFAGDPAEAHREGCRFVEEAMSVPVEPADIVITSNNGYPLDRNLYQVVKGIDTAAKAAKENGIIIAVARCEDRVGHTHFQDLLLSAASVEELRAKMSAPPSETDKWQVQVLARTLAAHQVILVSAGIGRELAGRMFFQYADTVAEAIQMALSMTGDKASFCVIPEGPVVIPRVKA